MSSVDADPDRPPFCLLTPPPPTPSRLHRRNARFLDAANARLMSALTQLKERYSMQTRNGISPTNPTKLQITENGSSGTAATASVGDGVRRACPWVRTVGKGEGGGGGGGWTAGGAVPITDALATDRTDRPVEIEKLWIQRGRAESLSVLLVDRL
ncbi:hypothetical protein ANANG_G00262180 [Anguilla anguilla]|uniref:Uncharacterized protein n=1 Tax=Anguilla anguilla TaxID=7936 RepID=A0A9D3LQB2_ANGAN|nr:hypothetical protein ANANG_G00262180 [Anguilla anguilla]